MLIADCIPKVCPTGAKFARDLQTAGDLYEIHNRLRIAHWLGQLAHESMLFQDLTENLNYSIEGLQKTWPSRFPSRAAAAAYARQPERIANKVYANRNGNGDEDSGDGWRFRGRGLKQLTGRDNYRRFSLSWLGDESLLDNPEKVAEPAGAVASAVWFWVTNRLNEIADKSSVAVVTKVVNGGDNGLAEREKWTAVYRKGWK